MKHLRKDLERLERRLLMLGARVEDAVRHAIRSLLDRDADIARTVIAGDPSIDQEEVEIEEDCLKILALHQPVAGDLRFVAACLKINNDLERIGDLATSVAKRALSMSKASLDPNQTLGTAPPEMEAMMESTTSMLRSSLNAFVRSDATLARSVLAQDDEVDSLNRETIEEMVARMKQGGEAVEAALLYLSASKSLERIADHATNIAEDVIYVVEGEIVRHVGAPRGDGQSRR